MTEFDDLLGYVIEEEHAPKNEFVARMEETIHPYEQFTDNEQMQRFIEAAASVPFDGINDAIIGKAYPAMVWKFREAALLGDIDKTRSIKMWLEWAEPYVNRPVGEDEGPRNPNTANFLPRSVK